MNDHERLKWAFEQSQTFFKLLTTIRSRRVGRGYRIDSGTEEASGDRPHAQAGERPAKFISKKDPLPLTKLEEALICWAACGPNGLVAGIFPLDGGFHELPGSRDAPRRRREIRARPTCSSSTTSGAYIYKPSLERSGPIEIKSEADYDKVVRWYEEGLIQILDQRPDIDFALRAPGAPNAVLMGPYQFNINMPGSTWFLPLTDAGWLNSALINLHGFLELLHDRRVERRPTGRTGKWIREGMLELPATIASEEQLIFQVEQFPTGCIVQNLRLATEAMGLGSWVFCGFNPDVLMGAMPEVTRGLGFHIEAPNPKAPISIGQVKIFGIEGVKEATYVPSPRYKSAEQLVKAWYDEKYGAGGTLHRGEQNYLRKVGSPWNSETTEAIIAHPRTRPAEWVQEALTSYIDYCVKTFGQWPVTYNPMQAHFGAVIHNVDEEFYDRYYKEGYIVNDTIRNRSKIWHD